MTPCDPPMPPNPVIAEQMYSRNGDTDCASLDSQTGGCSVKTEGPYLLEWRDWGSYGFAGFPNYGYTADCHASAKCLDTTLRYLSFPFLSFLRLPSTFLFSLFLFSFSTGFAGIQIGWTQKIVPAKYPSITAFKYWAKCLTATCMHLSTPFLIFRHGYLWNQQSLHFPRSHFSGPHQCMGRIHGRLEAINDRLCHWIQRSSVCSSK